MLASRNEDKKEDRPLNQTSNIGLFSVSKADAKEVTKPLTEEEILTKWREKDKEGAIGYNYKYKLMVMLEASKMGFLDREQLEKFESRHFFWSDFYFSIKGLLALKEGFTSLPQLMKLNLKELIEINQYLFSDIGFEALRSKIITVDQFMAIGFTSNLGGVWSQRRELLGTLLQHEPGHKKLISKELTPDMFNTKPMFVLEAEIEKIKPPCNAATYF